MISFNAGDKVVVSGVEGTVLRFPYFQHADKMLVDFEDGSSGKVIQVKSISAVNGSAVNQQLLKWKTADYQAMPSGDFTEDQLAFLKTFVSRITYRPHPYNFDKFVGDYEAVTGTECPMSTTNRHESAYSDCAEIHFSSFPPAGLFDFNLKQDGEQWFTENVGLAWALFRAGFQVSVPKD